MYEQKILIKNTKQEKPIILTFVEHVPKSTDEKIKVGAFGVLLTFKIYTQISRSNFTCRK
jgi:hypothetical protein